MPQMPSLRIRGTQHTCTQNKTEMMRLHIYKHTDKKQTETLVHAHTNKQKKKVEQRKTERVSWRGKQTKKRRQTKKKRETDLEKEKK